MVLSWYFRGFPWYFHGGVCTFMVLSWTAMCFHRVSIVVYAIYGAFLKFHGNFMDWCSHGTSMDSHGDFMGL